MGVLSISYLAYATIKSRSSDSTAFQNEAIWFTISFARMSVLLMLCDFQKSLINQVFDKWHYALIFLSDIFWISLAGAFMQMPTILGTSVE